MKLPSRFFAVPLALFSLAFSSRLCAAPSGVTWGGSNGNFNVGTNWDGGVVPGSGANAVIDSGTANFPAAYSDTISGLSVGNSGTAGLTISGSLTDTSSTVGNLAGSNGTATVSSGTWANTSTLTIGNSGTGSLAVNGGSLNDASDVLGSVAGSSGQATITGGTWSVSNTLTVGSSGNGSLTVNGGELTTPDSVAVGSASGGYGIVTVTSGTWNAAGAFITLGQSGTGALVLNGGYITCAGLNAISNTQSGSESVTISSGTLATQYGLTVGQSGPASLQMSGGTILSSELFIASGSGSTGTMVMTGGTMTLESSFESYVGESGTGSLTMNGAGGLITGTAAFLNVGGAVSSGTGTMTVTTGTVNLTGGSSLEVGNDGSGTLIVNGGYVYADSVTSGSIARITVSSGTLSCNTFTDAPAFNATISLTGSGVLQILSGSMDLGETGGRVNTLNLGAGGAAGTLLVAGVFDEGGAIGTINFNQSGTYSFAPRINGSFNINNVGTGITILGGSNNYTGSTTISAGTLQFAKINSMYFAGTATAASGATLAVNAGGTGEFTNGTSGYGTIGGLFSGLGGEAGSVVSLSTGADIGIDTTNAGGSLTYAGNITNPGIGLTKLGSGALVLTGDNTYTGTTTVASGTLTVNGSIASSPAVVNGGVLNGSGTTGNITVGSGGYLGGTLSSGVVVANAGGTVTAGDAPGANSMTSLTLSGSATYQEQIVVPGGGSYTGPGNHPIAGTDYGQTTLTGSGNAQTVLTLDSANSILQLSVTGSLPAGGVASNAKPYVVGGANSSLDNYFFLTLSNNTDLVSGKFAMVTSDGVNFTGINYTSSNLLGNSSVGTFTLNGQEWAIDYTGNIATNSDTGGNSVVITAIPEPASYVLLAFGGVALAMFERRRKVSEE